MLYNCELKMNLYLLGITGHRNRPGLFLSLITILTLVTTPPVAMAQAKVTIDIHPGIRTGQVNRYILGNNFIGAKSGFEADLFNNNGGGSWNPRRKTYVDSYLKAIKDAGVTVLRWPGGGWHNTLDWKKTIGPVADRPNQKFGLPEFLTLCENVGAIPLITLPTERFSASDLADFVEYLNAPDNHSNPNAGVDWATVRAADGRVKPWGIVWFELGNETFNTALSAEQYADLYEKIQAAIKKVDPKVKLGAVLEDSSNFDSGWTATVLTRVGKTMDFAVIHPYLTAVNERAAKAFPKESLAMLAVSSDADLAYRLERFNEVIRKLTGRSDIPLAATEYNGQFVQNNPVPFRFTLVNAIHNADYVRVMLQPQYNVLMANYWQLLGSYWGMIQKGNTSDTLTKEPNYFVYQIYHEYLGNELVKIDVASPRFDFPGVLGIGPRAGNPSQGVWGAYPGRIPSSWQTRWFSEVEHSQDNGVLTLVFHGDKDTNYYHASKEIEVQPDTLYKISVRARTMDLQNGKIGIAVEDARGWDKTFYQPANVSLTGTTPWTWLTIEYRTLTDAKKIRVMVRRFGGGGLIRGRAEFGEMRVDTSANRLGAVPTVAGVASIGEEGNELYAVLINKNLHEPVDASIQLDRDYEVISSEALTGPSPYSDNLNPLQPDLVKISNMRVEKLGGRKFMVRLPAVSVTGIRFRKSTK
jgi:alpha-L-arabinofuranosidase